jgi:hypothetical protein
MPRMSYSRKMCAGVFMGDLAQPCRVLYGRCKDILVDSASELDSLPPHSFASASAPAPGGPAYDAHLYAAGDVAPRGPRETELCSTASHADWMYLAALAALDTIGIAAGSSATLKFSSNLAARMSGPVMIGLPWGATIGGAWLALPKCSPDWVGEPPPGGDPRATWPLALSLALLAGATAPVINAIAIGSYDLPLSWSDEERVMHVVVAGVAGFAGALVPYLVPPRTWRAARELERIRLGTDGRSTLFLGYAVRF